MTNKPKVDPLFKNIGRISSPSRFFSPTVILGGTTIYKSGLLIAQMVQVFRYTGWNNTHCHWLGL